MNSIPTKNNPIDCPQFYINFGASYEPTEVFRIARESPEPVKDLFYYTNRYLAVVIKETQTHYVEIQFDANANPESYLLRKTKKELLNAYENLSPMVTKKSGETIHFDVVGHWLSSEHRQTYKKIVFQPYGAQNPTGSENLNLFRGFNHRFDPNFVVDEIRIKPILYHLEEIICNANEAGSYDYLLDLWAHIVQNPEKRTGKAIICYGKPGTGKSMIFEYFGRKIVGDQYFCYTENVQDITGTFTALRDYKLYAVLDEMTSATGSPKDFETFNRLKAMITQETITQRRMRQDPISIVNCLNIVLLSNFIFCAILEPYCRRFMCLKVNPVKLGDKEYFDRLATVLDDDETAKHFYHFLMRRNIDHWSIMTPIPPTQYRLDLMSMHFGPEVVFMKELAEQDELWVNDQFVSSQTLWDTYVKFCKQSGLSTKYVSKLSLSRSIGLVFKRLIRARQKDARGFLFNAEARNHVIDVLTEERAWDEERDMININGDVPTIASADLLG